MKKAVSILLAIILTFSVLAVCASAEGDHQTYYIAFDVNENNIQITPLEGYSRYVLPGEDFKFTVKATDDRSDTFVIVQANTFTIEPDIHGVYTISDINEDQTVKAFFSLEENQSNIFASVIMLIRNLIQWFMNIFDDLFAMAQP